jgi:hypothetical protein
MAAMIAASHDPALAQSARRDPTQPPAYGAQQGTVRTPIDSFRPEHVVTVDGQRYLVWQGRRYRVGDTIQGARIERVSEVEIWLRTENGLRKLALFPGIEKIPSRDTSATKGRGQ